MHAIEKVFLKPRYHHGQTGLEVLSPIDEASWVWHPSVSDREPVFLKFTRAFTATDEKLKFHVSADERYILYLDGKEISRGPDRAGVTRWSFASYQTMLEPGEHTFEAVAWHLDEGAPVAQLSHRGGFIFKAEGCYDSQLSTGTAEWMVTLLTGLSLSPARHAGYMAAGDALIFDSREFQWEEESFVPADVLRQAVIPSTTGVLRPGWLLFPSSLPDQISQQVKGGKIRAVAPDLSDRQPVTGADCASDEIPKWQQLIDGKGEVTVPPRQKLSILWDLEEYYCAYPSLTVSGGLDSQISWSWEEGLYEPESRHKYNRGEVEGKIFTAGGDHFICDGGANRRMWVHWWRAGRYCLITIETGDTPLLLHSLELTETRYPIENQSVFSCNDTELAPVIDICVRGIQACSHETFMDCPYYEQLMYVGDTRLEVLTTYIMNSDCRLPRRAIELFDSSRQNWGFVNERYPSRWPQLSTTFSMIWVLMLHDYYYWRGNLDWIRGKMVGLRSMLEHFNPYENSENLLEALPGWSFMDWVSPWMDTVAGWECGNPPDADKGVSSIVNLLYLTVLDRAAELEEMMEEPLLAQRLREKSSKVLQAVDERFWDEEKGLYADDLEHKFYSEHAQCLALLSGKLSREHSKTIFSNLLKTPDLARATIYFSFYLFEVFRRFNRGELIIERLESWKELVNNDLKTPIESPEPSRSDCHAWGSHPLFHLHASIAGIRPSSPEFKTVEIRPQPGSYRHIQSQIPHPVGTVSVALEFADGKCTGTVVLPDSVTGELIWNSSTVPLRSGNNSISTE